jgi:hypothetical protein
MKKKYDAGTVTSNALPKVENAPITFKIITIYTETIYVGKIFLLRLRSSLSPNFNAWRRVAPSEVIAGIHEDVNVSFSDWHATINVIEKNNDINIFKNASK